jgi:hypothetical protein
MTLSNFSERFPNEVRPHPAASMASKLKSNVGHKQTGNTVPWILQKKNVRLLILRINVDFSNKLTQLVFSNATELCHCKTTQSYAQDDGSPQRCHVVGHIRCRLRYSGSNRPTAPRLVGFYNVNICTELKKRIKLVINRIPVCQSQYDIDLIIMFSIYLYLLFPPSTVAGSNDEINCYQTSAAIPYRRTILDPANCGLKSCMY